MLSAGRGDLSSAERHFRVAIASDESHAEARNGLGIVLARTGHLGEAVAAVRHAVELDPDHAAAQENLRHLERAPPAR